LISKASGNAIKNTIAIKRPILFYGLINTMGVNCFAFVQLHIEMEFVVSKVYQTNDILLCWYSDGFNLVSESIISSLWLTEELFTERVVLKI